MRPAFSSTKQAALFALLLFLTLLSPVLAGKKILPPREEGYSRQGFGPGPYPWIQQQLFEETNDMDIVFIGSSRLYNDINTSYVQERLSRQLGRPAVVRTISWGGAGYDGLFFVAKDLLERRRVGMLVIYDENPQVGHYRNPQIPALFRYAEDADVLSGLTLSEQAMYYCSAVLGMPKNLLSRCRLNLPFPLTTMPASCWEQRRGSGNIVKQLGCARAELGFDYNRTDVRPATFVPFQPHNGVTPADVQVYSGDKKNDFEFGRTPLPNWQAHFARKLGELTRLHHCRLVMLHLPVLAGASEKNIPERAFWPAVFQTDVPMLGIPAAKLFAGLTDEELHSLFVESLHMNANGMDYFTPLITPSLLQLYESKNGFHY
jgi:hypothetical protein